MSCCYKIYLKNIPSGTPPGYLEDGQLMLDTEGGLTVTKNAEERSDIKKLKGDAVKTINIPKTPKNEYILSHFFHLALLFDDYPVLNVIVIDNGFPLVENGLEITSYNDGWVGKLVHTNEFWKNKSEELQLNEIELGEYIFTVQNMKDNMAAFRYVDAAKPVHFPHIDYGWFPEGFYPFRRLRPLFSPLAILRAIFCKLGYEFHSPILETNYFRDMWVYVLDQKFGEYEEKGKGGLGSKVSQVAQHSYQWFEKLAVSVNAGDWNALGSWDIAESWFKPGTHKGIGNYKIKIEANISSIANTGDGNGFIVKHMRSTNPANPTFYTEIDSQYVHYDAGSTPGNVVIEFEFFDFKDVDGYVDRLSVRTWPPNGVAGTPSTMVVESMVVTVTPSDGLIVIGDTIQLASLLRKEPAINFIVGIVELMGLKIVTNEPLKKVTMYHTTNVVLPTGEVPTTFYKKSTEPLDVVCDTKDISFGNKKSNKYVLRFKESTDGYISKSGIDEGDGLFSYSIGKGEEKVIKNSYFEPTVMRNFLGNYNKAILPIMVDNEPDHHGNFLNQSFNIEPRVLMSYGNVYQGTANNKIYIESEIIAPATSGKIDICFATQYWIGFINGNTAVTKNASYNGIKDDFFDLLWHNLFNNQYVGAKIGYKTKLKKGSIINFDFRKVYMIDDGVGSYTGVINSVLGHETCEDKGTKIVVHKYSNNSPCGCDVPCGCSLTTCYARTDYSIGIMHAPHNKTDTITSFILNGVEQLTNPVIVLDEPNGIVPNSIIWTDGSTYITNLVDGLNSLGIPFMTFGYAGSYNGANGPVKNMMTMTYPSCWTFEIYHQFGGDSDASWKITPDGAKRTFDVGATWEDWFYFDHNIPSCVTYNPNDQAGSCINNPTLLIEYATGVVQNAGQVKKILVNTGGNVSNVDQDVTSYRRTQVSPNWVVFTGNVLDYCIASAYVTMSHNIQFSQPNYFYIQFSNTGRCDGQPADSLVTTDANGNTIQRNVNGFTMLVNDANFATWGGSIDVIETWNSPAGIATRTITLTRLATSNPNLIDNVSITESNVSPTYDIDVKRETSYTDGCPDSLVTKHLP